MAGGSTRLANGIGPAWRRRQRHSADRLPVASPTRQIDPAPDPALVAAGRIFRRPATEQRRREPSNVLAGHHQSSDRSWR